MDEKKIVSNEEAKFILELADSRLNVFKDIRGSKYGRYMGLIPAGIVMLVPYLLKSDKVDYVFYLIIAVAIIAGVRQKWSDDRFDAIVDFLEKEGAIRK